MTSDLSSFAAVAIRTNEPQLIADIARSLRAAVGHDCQCDQLAVTHLRDRFVLVGIDTGILELRFEPLAGSVLAWVNRVTHGCIETLRFTAPIVAGRVRQGLAAQRFQ